MNTPIIEKKIYRAPLIVRIRLDNEISLALESTPDAPTGPNEGFAPEYLNNDPFKSNFA